MGMLEYGGCLYSTEAALAYALCESWLDAGGLNDIDEILAGGTDAELAREMIDVDDWTHEAVDMEMAISAMEDIRRDRISITIRAIRDELELTQAQLGERLGVSQPAVAQWEAGTTKPNLAQIGALRRLDDELGETLLHLL